MQARRRNKTLVSTMSAKVQASEEKLFRQLAAARGISASEWCREALLQAAACPSSTRLLLSELMAIRKLVVHLQLQAINGGAVTEVALKAALEQADSLKLAAADERIAKYFSASEVEGVEA